MYPTDEDFLFDILDPSGARATRVDSGDMPGYQEPASDPTGRLLDMAKDKASKPKGGGSGIGKEAVAALFFIY